MASDRRLEDAISSWLEETAPERLPTRALDATFERTRRSRQQVGWRTLLGRIQMPRFIPALGSAAVVVMAAVLALNFIPALGPGGPSTPSPSTSPIGPEVTATLNGFLEARVAGAGAEQYLSNEEVIPLLYTTTSGTRYERAEFEQVPGIEWPHGYTAFKVRLFAGNTMVEQLFFAGSDGSLLSYERDGFATDIAPTTENGQPVAVSYGLFLGEVTLNAAHPWVINDNPTYPNPLGRLIPEGPGMPPTTDGGQRHEGWDQLFLIADPELLGGPCQGGPNSVDAAALAESIRSHPSIEATAPMVVNVGGAEALMMDVKIAAGTTIYMLRDVHGDLCRAGILSPVLGLAPGGPSGNQATGDWMRVYLVDAPEGSSMRTLGIAIVAPEARFQRVMEAAAPILNSITFHAP